VSDIARDLREPKHRIAYAIRQAGVTPAAKVGRASVYPRGTVRTVKQWIRENGQNRELLLCVAGSAVPDGEATRVAPEHGSEPEQPTERLGVRVTPSLMRALRKAQAGRMVDKLCPFKVQDIVTDALCVWLLAHGYTT